MWVFMTIEIVHSDWEEYTVQYNLMVSCPQTKYEKPQTNVAVFEITHALTQTYSSLHSESKDVIASFPSLDAESSKLGW